MNQNQGGQQTDCVSEMKQWWQTVPFLSKSLIVVCSVITVLDSFFFGYYLQYLFVDYPILTFIHFHLWTPFTTVFVHQGFIDLLLSLWMINRDGQTIERSIGSVHYFLELMLKNVLIQILFLSVMLLLGLLVSDAFWSMPSQGLFPTVFLFLTMKSLANPEQDVQFLCFPFQVKMKHYPWLLLLLFTLFGGLRFDLLSAIIIAYIEVKYFNGQFVQFPLAKLTAYENSFFFKQFNTRPDFVKCQEAAGINVQPGQLNIGQRNQQQYPSQVQQQQQPTLFAGQSVRIDSVIQNQPQQANQVVINPAQSQNQQNQGGSMREQMIRAAEQRKLQNELAQRQQQQLQQQNNQQIHKTDQEIQQEMQQIHQQQQQEQQQIIPIQDDQQLVLNNAQENNDKNKSENKKGYNKLTDEDLL